MLSIFTLRLVFLLLYTFVLSCNFRCAYSLVNNPVASFPRANPVPNVQLTDPSAEINRKRKCCAHVSPTMFFSREKKAPLHKLHYFSRSPLRLQMNGAPSWIPWPGRFFSLLISCSIAYSKTHPLHVLENSHQQRPDNRHRPRHPAPTRTLQVLLGEGKHLLPKASLFPPSPCVIPPSRPRTPAAPAADAPAAATPLATRAASVRQTTRWYAAPAAKAWCPLPLAAPSRHHSPAATAPRWAPADAAQSARPVPDNPPPNPLNSLFLPFDLLYLFLSSFVMYIIFFITDCGKNKSLL